MIRILFLASSIFLIAGCQNMGKTMFAHHTISKEMTRVFAGANAAVNICIAENKLDRENAYQFSTTMANFLDLVVFDENYYRETYERALRAPGPINCSTINADMPRETEKLRAHHRHIAADIGRARAEESREIAQTLRGIGALGVNPPVLPRRTEFPPLQFRSELPPTQSYLIQTRNGQVHCKVTNNSYVFCL